MQVNGLKVTDPSIALQPANINLDQGLTLRGFGVPNQANRGTLLPVETAWLAGQKLSGDYHLFMHVFDKTGKLIAQYDGIPNDGNFPTTQWAASQAWETVIPLSLSADASPGTAEVYVGWYRYPDLLRLAVHAVSKRAEDGLVFLKTVEIQ